MTRGQHSKLAIENVRALLESEARAVENLNCLLLKFNETYNCDYNEYVSES